MKLSCSALSAVLFALATTAFAEELSPKAQSDAFVKEAPGV